ncbi:MAG: DUF4173 domain-containing protein [Anaerolineae bacterium]|nr:DUF4173 domain-containing protein [Anaerolineae bacterium]
MKKYLLPVSTAIGLLFDLLFWKKAPGISFPLFVLLGVSAGWLLLKTDGKSPKQINCWLLVPILFFSAITVLRREPMTVFLGFLFTFFCVLLLPVSWLNGLWPAFNLADYAVNFVNLVGGILTLPWREQKTAGDEQIKKGKKSLGPILRGLALSLPVWLMFIALLSSADLIFAQRLDALLKNFNLGNMSELLVQAILVALVGFFFAGAVLFAAQRSARIKLAGADKPWLVPLLGMTEAAILLGGVILLFGVFVAMQFRYFFSGQANITLDGFTYAEYARRGFGELLSVAFLSVLMQQAISLITRRETVQERRAFTAFSLTIIALVLVILVSAFQRLTLYESAYGFTRMRTYPHVFMLWLGVLLVAVAVMEVLGRQRWFINAAILAAMGFGATLGIMNVDRLIVQRNLRNAAAGMPLDAGYLASLSSDAIPVLVENLAEDTLPESVREGVGAALVCYRDVFANDALKAKPWPSYHFSESRAQQALQGVHARLEDYHVNNETWPAMVAAPSGKIYSCQSVTGMD